MSDLPDESNSSRLNRLSLERLRERFGDAAMPELPEEILSAPVRFWMCINRAHKSVVWDRDVARCPDCGVTSDITTRYRETALRFERERLAGELRRASAGRTHYAAGYPEGSTHRKVLETEANTFDQAARIVEGDVLVMCGILPTFMWGPTEDAALKGAEVVLQGDEG